MCYLPLEQNHRIGIDKNQRSSWQAMHMAHHMRKTLISASADLRIFLLVGKRPKPVESQVPCELRTPRALMFCL